MRRGSVVGPLILIAIGALFLMNNLRPELPLIGLLARFWPFLLIGWGALRLLEIAVWTLRRRPLPAAGVSGGEWALVVLIALTGSGLFFFNERAPQWPPFRVKMKGIEVFGESFDYPIAERTARAGKAPRIVIENARGNARVTAADGEDVKVSGRKTVRSFTREQADSAAKTVEPQVTADGSAVVIRSTRADTREQVVSTDLEIQVPRDAHIEFRGRYGDLDVAGIGGDVDVESDNAGVRLANIGGKVRVETKASDIIRAVGVAGPVDLKGFGQDVELENVQGQVTVSGAYFGEVQLRNIAKPVRFAGGVRSRTTEVRAEACPGHIRISRGDMTMEGVTGPVLVTAKSKDVVVSDFTESLEVRLDKGDADIRPGRAPLPKIDVATQSGEIELSLPENARFSLKATVKRGEIENEFGETLKEVKEGRGGVLAGSSGSGAAITLATDRGSVRIRKASPAEPLPPAPPRAPKAPPRPLTPEQL